MVRFLKNDLISAKYSVTHSPPLGMHDQIRQLTQIGPDAEQKELNETDEITRLQGCTDK